jgi:hypothetical protein
MDQNQRLMESNRLRQADFDRLQRVDAATTHVPARGRRHLCLQQYAAGWLGGSGANVESDCVRPSIGAAVQCHDYRTFELSAGV